MSYNDKKSTPADVAATLVILVLAAAIAVLLCIYILKLGGAFEPKPEPVQTTHVISEAPVTETTTETEVIITTTSAVTVESTPAITIPLGEYDEAFFDSTFIVGDSLSTGFVNYEFLPADKVFAQAGLTPSSIMFTEVGGTLVYDKAAEADPEYICIMLGTNGIAYLEADFMSEKMSLFIDELRMNCPEAEIVLVSIPPVTAEHEINVPETNIDRIKLYNSCIEKLAEEKVVIWVETYSILCDDTGYLAEEYAETDGLHLKIHAYPVILSRIQEALMNAELAEEAETITEAEASSETEAEETTEGTTATTVPEETEAMEASDNY